MCHYFASRLLFTTVSLLTCFPNFRIISPLVVHIHLESMGPEWFMEVYKTQRRCDLCPWCTYSRISVLYTLNYNNRLLFHMQKYLPEIISYRHKTIRWLQPHKMWLPVNWLVFTLWCLHLPLNHLQNFSLKKKNRREVFKKIRPSQCNLNSPCDLHFLRAFLIALKNAQAYENKKKKC